MVGKRVDGHSCQSRHQGHGFLLQAQMASVVWPQRPTSSQVHLIHTCIDKNQRKIKKIIALLLMLGCGEVTSSYHSSPQPGLVSHFISFCFVVATQKINQ